MKLLIYMPALNEQANIKRVIESLPRALAGVSTVQVLVVDDGSVDETVTTALSCGAQVVSHARNRGVGAAFQSAVRFALVNGADALVGIDADGQFDPEQIPALIEPILAGKADMVIGNRFSGRMPVNMPPLKYWGNYQIARIVSYVSGQSLQDVSCGFRSYSREALLHLNLFADFTYSHETILSLAFQGLRIIEFPVKVRYDPERKSRVAGSIIKYAAQTSKIILRVLLDYRPIRVFGVIGMALIFIGVLFVLYLLGYYAFAHSFSPYKSFGFIGLGFLIFGFLVVLIALIADMLNRLRINQDRILYEIKKIQYGK